MLWNLEAEQKRRGLSNEEMAKLLSVSRTTYEVKKKNGKFSLPQIETLLDYFKCDFGYLFKREDEAS